MGSGISTSALGVEATPEHTARLQALVDAKDPRVLALLEAVEAEPAPAGGGGKDQWLRVFAQVDTDSSGAVDRKELRSALEALGLNEDLGPMFLVHIRTFAAGAPSNPRRPLTPARAVGALDGNGDGTVSLDEWTSLMPPELDNKILTMVGGDGQVKELSPPAHGGWPG